MEIFAYSVAWDKVVEHYQAGTLGENLSKVPSDAFDSWVFQLDLDGDSIHLYNAVAMAYEQLREGLPEDVRSLTDSFFNPLITTNGTNCFDLGPDDGMFFLTISPQSVMSLAEIGHTIDFETFRAPFYAKCEDSEKEMLAEYGNTTPEQSFENSFLPYIQMWLAIFKAAAENGRGLLFYAG
jgi:hypothetical protein